MPYQQNTKILLAYHHLERLMRWWPTFSMPTFSHTPLTSPLSQCSNLSSLSRLLPPLLMAQTSILGVPNLMVVDVCRAILQQSMSIRNQPLATPTCLSHPAVVVFLLVMEGCTTLVPTNWTESYGSICDFHEISNAENRYIAACVAGNLLTDPPQYCFSAWCYVSKDCPSAVKSGEFPMATDLYYSYATCSNKDSYSETSSTSSGERLMVGAVAAVVGLVSLAM